MSPHLGPSLVRALARAIRCPRRAGTVADMHNGRALGGVAEIQVHVDVAGGLGARGPRQAGRIARW